MQLSHLSTNKKLSQKALNEIVLAITESNKLVCKNLALASEAISQLKDITVNEINSEKFECNFLDVIHDVISLYQAKLDNRKVELTLNIEKYHNGKNICMP